MSVEIDVKPFQVDPSARFDFKSFPNKLRNFRYTKEDCEQALGDLANKIRELQDKLYASDSWAVLVILQGMDTSGKDGIVDHVFTAVKPQGLQVTSFGPPSKEELDHDFFWRSEKAMPERGRIAVHNRSYYEEVIVVRVHPEFLKAEKLPFNLKDSDIWKMRYDDINNFESRLAHNGVRVVKFFINISKEEQKQRLLKRLEDPSKVWKFREGDIDERAHWDEYQDAYRQCLKHTSTETSPWYVIPGDVKAQARVIVAQAIIDNLEELQLKYPTVDPKEIARLKARLEKS